MSRKLTYIKKIKTMLKVRSMPRNRKGDYVKSCITITYLWRAMSVSQKQQQQLTVHCLRYLSLSLVGMQWHALLSSCHNRRSRWKQCRAMFTSVCSNWNWFKTQKYPMRISILPDTISTKGANRARCAVHNRENTRLHAAKQQFWWLMIKDFRLNHCLP